MLERFEKFFVLLNKAALGLLMALMFILVFSNVVSRYCFGYSFGTSEEVSTFLMIWVTYLGAGLALRQGRHAAINLFQDRLSGKARRALRAFLGLVILAFFALLAFFGVRFAAFGMAQETAATQIPLGIPYLAVPLGAVVFGLHLVLGFKEWLNQDWEEEETEEMAFGNG